MTDRLAPLVGFLLSVLTLPARAESTFERLGPHPVGVRTLVLVDPSRHDEYTRGDRALLTEIWYPADERARGAAPTSFLEFFGEHREAAARFVEHFGGQIDEVNRRFKVVAVRDAPLRKGVYPLLIFSHGNGGVRHQNATLMDHLASHGYIVAAPDHTGNAGVAALPGGAVPYDREGRSRSAKDRPLDVSFLITRFLEESSRDSGWLGGAIDSRKIGVLGHSFGGFTATRVADTDERVRAVLAMTFAYGQGTPVPAMLMLGERDRTVKAAGNALIRTYYTACRGPKYLLSFPRGGHFTFTDMDRIAPDFGDGIGKDRKTGEAFLPMEEARKRIKAYGLAFFDRHLKEDSDAARFLEGGRQRSEDVRLETGNLAGQLPADPPRRRKVLIVTGDDVPAHDWRATTPVTRMSLEQGGELEVYVSEDAGILETSALERYDAVVLNYRNHPRRDPGPRARQNLAAFVKSGKGLVVVHFAVHAFAGWEEYRQIIGRVWVGKRDGKKISGHSPRGPFHVDVVDRKHAITRGLQAFRTDDELYSNLVGAEPIHVLLEAHSDTSGRREPIAWTRTYGEGRVFVSVLGHDVAARRNPAVQTLLRRGTRWAAGN